MLMSAAVTRPYLVACDFDQTLSFNDSGIVLSELIGASNFRQKVAGLSGIHLVQQGAELAYLLRHDPEFRCVRREHLVEAGTRVHLKDDIKRLVEFLDHGVDGCRFLFRVISAAPKPIIESALEGNLQIGPDRTTYVGDGRSDVHVMLHVNNRDGFTIAVSEVKFIARIAKRTVVSDNALSVLVPILEDVVGWDAARIRRLFESYGLVLQEWDKARTDWVTLRDTFREDPAPDAALLP